MASTLSTGSIEDEVLTEPDFNGILTLNKTEIFDNERISMPALLVFVYLQLLDLLSTVLFTSLGVCEGNPIARLAMTYHGAFWGMFLLKLVSTCIVAYFYLKINTAKVKRIMSVINCLLMAVVVWNLAMLIILIHSVKPAL